MYSPLKFYLENTRYILGLPLLFGSIGGIFTCIWSTYFPDNSFIWACTFFGYFLALVLILHRKPDKETAELLKVPEKPKRIF